MSSKARRRRRLRARRSRTRAGRWKSATPAAIAKAIAPCSRPWNCTAPSPTRTSPTSPISATAAAAAIMPANTRRRTNSASTCQIARGAAAGKLRALCLAEALSGAFERNGLITAARHVGRHRRRFAAHFAVATIGEHVRHSARYTRRRFLSDHSQSGHDLTALAAFAFALLALAVGFRISGRNPARQRSISATFIKPSRTPRACVISAAPGMAATTRTAHFPTGAVICII